MKKIPIWFLLVIVIAVALLVIWLVVSVALSETAGGPAQWLVDFFNKLLRRGV
ncbi:MAG: hypothetical protein ACE5J7_00205 [Candidatus Aenigmatarchaeota archaeon]